MNDARALMGFPEQDEAWTQGKIVQERAPGTPG